MKLDQRGLTLAPEVTGAWIFWRHRYIDQSQRERRDEEGRSEKLWKMEKIGVFPIQRGTRSAVGRRHIVRSSHQTSLEAQQVHTSSSVAHTYGSANLETL